MLPDLNPTNVSLAQREREHDWHPQHGPPAVSRGILDEVCTILRALFIALPLDQITQPTKTSQDPNRFVRQYSVPLAKRLQAAEAFTTEDILRPSESMTVVVDWLIDMSGFKRGSGNKFQWIGFPVYSKVDAREVCDNAVLFAVLSYPHDSEHPDDV